MDELHRRWLSQRPVRSPWVDEALNPDVRTRLELKIRPRRIGVELLTQRALDVTRLGLAGLDSTCMI